MSDLIPEEILEESKASWEKRAFESVCDLSLQGKYEWFKKQAGELILARKAQAEAYARLNKECGRLNKENAQVIEECKDLRLDNERLYKRLARLEKAGVLWADAASVRLSRE